MARRPRKACTYKDLEALTKLNDVLRYGSKRNPKVVRAQIARLQKKCGIYVPVMRTGLSGVCPPNARELAQKLAMDADRFYDLAITGSGRRGAAERKFKAKARGAANALMKRVHELNACAPRAMGDDYDVYGVETEDDPYTGSWEHQVDIATRGKACDAMLLGEIESMIENLSLCAPGGGPETVKMARRLAIAGQCRRARHVLAIGARQCWPKRKPKSARNIAKLMNPFYYDEERMLRDAAEIARRRGMRLKSFIE